MFRVYSLATRTPPTRSLCPTCNHLYTTQTNLMNNSTPPKLRSTDIKCTTQTISGDCHSSGCFDRSLPPSKPLSPKPPNPKLLEKGFPGPLGRCNATVLMSLLGSTVDGSRQPLGVGSPHGSGSLVSGLLIVPIVGLLQSLLRLFL